MNKKVNRFAPKGDWAVMNLADGEAGTSRHAVLEIYDEIGFWGVTVEDVANWIRDIDQPESTPMDVRINSTGGDAFAGITVMNLLRDYPGRVRVTVDGLAASAASVIAMGGDEVVMNLGSQLMVHEANAMGAGDSGDLRKLADALDTVSDSIAGVYAHRAGGTRGQWREVMKQEQWYTAEEAVLAGLADLVATAVVDEDDRVNVANRVRIFNYAGRGEAPRPFIPEVSKNEQLGNEVKGLDIGFKTEICNRLGITAPIDEIDEAMVLAALDEALAEGVDEVEEEQAEQTAEDEQDDEVELPEGVVAVSQEVLDQLKELAELGRELSAEKDAQQRAGVVENAVKAGKIAPARRDHWVEAIKADPGAVDVLNGLEPGLIPVASMGVAEDDNTGMTDADELYNRVYRKN